MPLRSLTEDLAQLQVSLEDEPEEFKVTWLPQSIFSGSCRRAWGPVTISIHTKITLDLL